MQASTQSGQRIGGDWGVSTSHPVSCTDVDTPPSPRVRLNRTFQASLNVPLPTGGATCIYGGGRRCDAMRYDAVTFTADVLFRRSISFFSSESSFPVVRRGAPSVDSFFFAVSLRVVPLCVFRRRCFDACERSIFGARWRRHLHRPPRATVDGRRSSLRVRRGGGGGTAPS